MLRAKYKEAKLTLYGDGERKCVSLNEALLVNGIRNNDGTASAICKVTENANAVCKHYQQQSEEITVEPSLQR